MTPLLFMGQEWAASTPFLFFTDFDAGARAAGGRGPAAGVRGVSGVRHARQRPSASPIRRRTPRSRRARLRWDELDRPRARAACSRCTATLLRAARASGRRSRRATRRGATARRRSTTTRSRSGATAPGAPAIARRRAAARRAARSRVDGARRPAGGRPLLDTEDAGLRRAIRCRRGSITPAGTIDFQRPGAVRVRPGRGPEWTGLASCRPAPTGCRCTAGSRSTAARDIVPYLQRLGVGAVYTSPYFAAEPGQHARLRRHQSQRAERRKPAAPRRTPRSPTPSATPACSTSSTSCPITWASARRPTRGGATCSRTAPDAPSAHFFDIDWNPFKTRAAAQAAAADPRRPVRPGARARRAAARASTTIS